METGACQSVKACHSSALIALCCTSGGDHALSWKGTWLQCGGGLISALKYQHVPSPWPRLGKTSWTAWEYDLHDTMPFARRLPQAVPHQPIWSTYRRASKHSGLCGWAQV